RGGRARRRPHSRPPHEASNTSFEHAPRRVAVGADDDLLSVAAGDEPQLLAAVLAYVSLEERPRVGTDRYAHGALQTRREQAFRFQQRRIDGHTLPPAHRLPDIVCMPTAPPPRLGHKGRPGVPPK